MNIDLIPYTDKRICVAVSGGRDSMALLHYLYTHAKEYSISLSALNCDHAIRENSPKDSQFVLDWCALRGVPVIHYINNDPANKTSEQSARLWRRRCFKDAAAPQVLPDGKKWQGYDYLATAHHLQDNAETLLFNLSRGAGLNGMRGILPMERAEGITLIRPMIDLSSQEIDLYITENDISYVVDESNLTDEYTRNKIRHAVLPALEKAVAGATGSIHRFSKLAQEDEEYFSKQVERIWTELFPYGYRIARCAEPSVFKRAALKTLEKEQKKDYTFSQLSALFDFQQATKGKKYQFLGMTVFQEEKGIFLCRDERLQKKCPPVEFARFQEGETEYEGELFLLTGLPVKMQGKSLTFDKSKIPRNAVVRFAKEGDTFHRFGGGRKSLGDYFTDQKIPVWLRKNIPLVAVDSAVLLVGGMEIADEIKVTKDTKKEEQVYLTCQEYQLL